MKFKISLKVFAVALVLTALIIPAALISAQSSREVLSLINKLQNVYIPAYGNLARANLRSVEEGLYFRRLIVLSLNTSRDMNAISKLEKAANSKSADVENELASIRRLLSAEIATPSSFEDKAALSRLDTRVEFLQSRHAEYERARSTLDAQIESGRAPSSQIDTQELDHLRDLYGEELEVARRQMMQILDNATRETVKTQSNSANNGALLLGLALTLGLGISAFISVTLVKPLRRLLKGVTQVQHGFLDTELEVSSRDEVGDLTIRFNSMVKELRVKERVRETFGRYLDPRIVESLIDDPDCLGAEGERREITILFCDMKGFTTLSEGMTPSGMVRVLNRYLSVMSNPVRRNNGIIDKYLGDAIMAFWGPPFTSPKDHARLACAAGLDQLAALASLRDELPEITGLRRGLPPIDIRVGVATGDVVIGNIGSDFSMSYTVMGDTVNFAARLESANKAYRTRFLVGARTAEMAADAFEFREIDTVRVIGKQEAQSIFEVLGRKGELPSPVLAMAMHYAEGLAAYRRAAWNEAKTAFSAALAAVPDDGPSAILFDRASEFALAPPPEDWNGIWELTSK